MAESRKESMSDPPASQKGNKPDVDQTDKPFDLDEVLVNELGQFGLYQLRNLLLVAIPTIMSAFMTDFALSVAAVPHRCRIPECGEDSKDHMFEPEWVLNAIPETSSGFASCARFAHVGNNGTLDYCPASLFNQNIITECSGYVYARSDSAVYDFDLACNEWGRVLAGLFVSLGSLVVLPIVGIISDRFGRRMALIIMVFNMSLFGVIRAFSVNYAMYLAMSFLQTALGGGIFSAAYIFGAELVGPKYRVLVSAFTSSMFATGQVILGAVSWGTQNWRYTVMILNAPCFLIVSYYWILSESIRWLISKKKYDKAKKMLEKVATTNNKELTEKTLQSLMNQSKPTNEQQAVTDKLGLFKTITKSSVLLRRVCTTPIWWITATFVYYGLSINSVGLSDEMHLNYILTCAIELPGFFTAVLLLDRIGRKATLSGGFFLSAACNVAFIFIPDDLYVLRLIVYLLGKFGISAVMTSLYLYTSELYPTEYRHSLLAFSSMIGRLGNIAAPLTPALVVHWHGIPSVMFGSMGLLAGLLVLTQPETYGTKMPDTLAEAEALGRR